ncbi:MAG TPA: right-handed parallel beta-helix repeat-containing protein, partial [Candidatus Udaeobacter sp.]|nr:right-handed parallel beta-helix repeat-containing protein [Candidatus Udaeobacter sp.]
GSGPFPPRIESNLFSGNEIGVIFVQGGQAYITGNTFVSGTTGIILNDGATPVIANNIFSNTYAGVVCNPSKPPPQPDFACNDAWNNTLGSYVGCIDPTGSDGNIAQDPLFCDVQNDYRLRSKSPCLPEHSPTDCGLIGAFGACMATTVSEAVPAPERSFFSVESNPVSYGPVFLMDDFQDVAAIEIYAANGRLTAVLHSKAPRVQWAPPAAQPRGVYFARAVTATGGSIVKFVLVR